MSSKSSNKPQKNQAKSTSAKPAPKRGAELSDAELKNVSGGLIALLNKPGG